MPILWRVAGKTFPAEIGVESGTRRQFHHDSSESGADHSVSETCRDSRKRILHTIAANSSSRCSWSCKQGEDVRKQADTIAPYRTMDFGVCGPYDHCA